MQDDDRSVEYDGPLVVLVNRFSASASEILAGALQDYGRAMIVGDEHTHGKGTVQALLDLDRYVSLRGMEKYMPLGAVKVTIQKFYRISGESTQEKGVIPDVVLPSRLDGLESGEKYLEFALPWDTINSADYRRWRSPPKNLNQLRKDSKDRISKEKEFQEIILEGQEGQKNRQETRQSLLLKTMLKERDQLSAFSKGDFSHGSQMGKNGKKDKESKTLDEEIAEDPYVGEGIALLNELLGGQS